MRGALENYEVSFPLEEKKLPKWLLGGVFY
jgi:hypothetical protein